MGPLFLPGQDRLLGLPGRAPAGQLAGADLPGGEARPHGEATADRAGTPATLQVAWGLAATAVASWIGRGELPHLDGKLQTLDVLTGETQTHTLVRLPSCPACGEPGARSIGPCPALVLQSCKKTFTEDGGHRVCSPQQTLERYGHHVSPITGAVSMLERDGTGGDGVLHVYLSGHNSRPPRRSLRGLAQRPAQLQLRQGHQRRPGQGQRPVRGPGALLGRLPRRRAAPPGPPAPTWATPAIAPNDCLLFSDQPVPRARRLERRRSPLRLKCRCRSTPRPTSSGRRSGR